MGAATMNHRGDLETGLKGHGEHTPLLPDGKEHESAPQDHFVWKLFHVIFFLTWGLCFLAGTTFFYFPDMPESSFYSAVFYIVGSCGFLAVDTQEILTSTSDPWLRTNMMCSWVGSLLYVIGSAGFLPDVYAVTDQIGIQGFIWGSLFIGSSQFW